MPLYLITSENRSMLVDPSDVEMTPPVFVKTPSEKLQYTWDWMSWLLDGDEIVEYVVTTPSGLTSAGSTSSETRVITVVGGGTPLTQYEVVCQITTQLGLVAERSITIKVVSSR